MKGDITSTKYLAYKVVFIYAFVSSLWILCSDWVLELLTKGSNLYMNLQTFKGWGFVLATSGLLYTLIHQGLQKLSESYNLLQSIMEGTTDAIFVKDLQGCYVMVNLTAAQSLGKTAAETIGKDDTEFFLPENARQLQENDQEIIKTGQIQTIEEIAQTNRGCQIYLSTKYVYRDQTGKIIGLIGISWNISEYYKANQGLQQTKEQLEAVVCASPLAIFVQDSEGRVKMWNPAAERIFGWQKAEAIDRPINMIPPYPEEEIKTLCDRALQGESTANVEIQPCTSTGSVINISMSTAPLDSMSNQINGMMTVVANISDRKRLEVERSELIEQLKQQTEDLTALSIVTANSISTLDLEELLSVLLQRIVTVTQADIAVIFLSEGDYLRVGASIGLSAELASNYTVAIGAGFAGTIAAARKPLYREDAQADTRLCPNSFCKELGIHTLLGVPLKRHDTLVGVLEISWCSTHPYSDRALHLLEITAERCAMAILNAQLYEQAKHLQERLQLQFDWMPIGCIFFNPEFHITEWNPAAEQIFGFSKEEVIDRECNLIVPQSALPDLQAILQRLIEGEMAIHTVIESIAKDGRSILCEWQNTAVKKPDGTPLGVLSMVQDITEQQQTQKQLWKYAFYDPLTELPNRNLFLAWLKQRWQRTKTSQADLFAVLYLDLNRFQVVKYSLGYQVANELLLAVTARIKACQTAILPSIAGKITTIAHVGIDEFAILVEGIHDAEDACAIAGYIQEQFAPPFELNSCEVFTNSSIGLVLSSIDYQQPEDLLQAAETAMNQAKSSGTPVVFDTAMQDRAVKRLQLDADLRRALENYEFQLYYQPIISLSNHQILGFEALVRWLHPQRGLVGPDQFIPLAEETGLIVPLGAWVMSEACRQIMLWKQRFPTLSPLFVSVNVSTVQLIQTDFLEQVDQIILETGIEPENLKLEITETAVMESTQGVTNIFEHLQSRGIHLSIDDFGTGYSSLSYLHSLPFDTLKIDRSFVNNLSVDTKHQKIIRTIIKLARDLEMELIAEGIETNEQLNLLQELKCGCGQGYFFSKPLDRQATEALLSGWAVI